MFRSATFKLTMWYLAIVMVISLSFSFVVYHFAAGELGTGLQHQTQRIFREFPVFDNNPYLVQHQDNDLAAGEHHILWRLFYFNLLVLVGAGFLSDFLARRTLEPIEAAHEQQKRFTADVSHELRTPLTSLKMSSEVALLDKQADKKALREALESNLEDAAKMELLINSLLRLTRLDDEQIATNFQAVHTQAVVEAAISQMEKLIKDKAIKVTSSGDDFTVRGDENALVQLVVILLDNAIKYSKPGGTVELTTAKRAELVVLTVKDQGQGIKKEALPHVFDRFYRQDSARSNGSTEGFGIGLSIAKLIADRHQADITLTSQPGKGTTASVSLPLAKD